MKGASTCRDVESGQINVKTRQCKVWKERRVILDCELFRPVRSYQMAVTMDIPHFAHRAWRAFGSSSDLLTALRSALMFVWIVSASESM